MNKSFYLNKLNKLSSFEIFSIPKFRYAEINYKHNFNFLRFFNCTPGKTTHKRNYFQRLHLIKKFSLISCDRNEARNVNQSSCKGKLVKNGSNIDEFS